MRKLFIFAAIVTGLVLGEVSSSAVNSFILKDQSVTIGKSTLQKNEEGINESYLGCLMFDNDNNSIQKCSDMRWGSEQALQNNVKTPSTVTIENLKKATPPEASQE